LASGGGEAAAVFGIPDLGAVGASCAHCAWRAVIDDDDPELNGPVVCFAGADFDGDHHSFDV